MELKMGARIAALRRAKGMTQEQLASALGVSAAAVSKWETDNSYPDITLLCPLARALDTDGNALLSFEETLTDEQAEARCNELIGTLRSQGAQAAEAQLDGLMRQYPNSVALKFYGAYVLLVLETQRPGCAPEQREKWRKKRQAWMQAVYDSGLAEYWQAAVTELASMALSDGDPDRAEALLDRLPKYPGDATATRMQLHLARGDREQAQAVLQKRLFVLVRQAQDCLMMMLNPQVEQDDARRLAIAEACRGMDGIFGGGISYGVLVGMYRSAGRIDDALEALNGMVDALTGSARMVDSVLFSTMQPDSGMAADMTVDARRLLLRELEEKPEWDAARGNPAFDRALESLRKSLVLQ